MINAFSDYDFYGRCLDAAIPIVAGLICLVYYPRRFAKDVKAGKLSDIQAATRLKKVKLCCYFLLLFGLYKITTFFF